MEKVSIKVKITPEMKKAAEEGIRRRAMEKGLIRTLGGDTRFSEEMDRTSEPLKLHFKDGEIELTGDAAKRFRLFAKQVFQSHARLKSQLSDGSIRMPRAERNYLRTKRVLLEKMLTGTAPSDLEIRESSLREGLRRFNLARAHRINATLVTNQKLSKSQVKDIATYYTRTGEEVPEEVTTFLEASNNEDAIGSWLQASPHVNLDDLNYALKEAPEDGYVVIGRCPRLCNWLGLNRLAVVLRLFGWEAAQYSVEYLRKSKCAESILDKSGKKAIN